MNFLQILVRWALFFIVALPLQFIFYPVWLVCGAIFYLCIRGRFGVPLPMPEKPDWEVAALIDKGKQDQTRDLVYLNNTDDHGAMTHLYLWRLRPELAIAGMRGLVEPDGRLKRHAPLDAGNPVSGDALSAWVMSFVMNGGDKDQLRLVVKQYLKGCFGMPAHQIGFWPSDRSSNGGVNFVPDSAVYMCQPAGGPQYFSSAGLLLLAADRLGGIYWLIYFLHYWLMGGWLFTFIPFVGPWWNELYYVQHVTVMNVYSVARLSGNPFYLWTMRYLVKKCAPSGNFDPVFYAAAAEVGALTEEEINIGIQGVRRIQRRWPQCSPTNPGFWTTDKDSGVFSIVACCAHMLEKAKFDKNFL